MKLPVTDDVHEPREETLEHHGHQPDFVAYDDAYYTELRAGVLGKGAFTALVGTSAKALTRAVDKIKSGREAQQRSGTPSSKLLQPQAVATVDPTTEYTITVKPNIQDETPHLTIKVDPEEFEAFMGAFAEDQAANSPPLAPDSSVEYSESRPPDRPTNLAVVRGQLSQVLQTLSKREAAVVSMRFGLDDGTPKTMEEVGRAYGLTRERVRQIESKAIAKLRDYSGQA
jgi:RNA polymerase sigma factor (sigma-70 family)